MFRRSNITDPLERLEQEANDDFRMLDELGAAFFGADHLMELHAEIRERAVFVQKRRKLLMILGITATGWLLLAAMAWGLGFIWVAYAALGGASAVSIAFAAVFFHQKKRTDGAEKLEKLKFVIEEELRNRAQRRREKKH